MNELSEPEKRFIKAKAYITPGFALPTGEETRERKLGLCLHHSYVPELPLNRNYAEIFNEFHFGKLADWKKIDKVWVNPDGSWYGLRYDFVVAYKKGIVSQFWSSMRWILQLGGGHAVNKKGEHWPRMGALVRPNSELVSVCVVGNYDRYALPIGALEMVREIAKATDVLPNLFFHSDFDFKTCPGSKVSKSDVSNFVFHGHQFDVDRVI